MKRISPIGKRLALKLDTEIVFEALILNRLIRLPAARREEWLRGLLVRGFQDECRAIREVQPHRIVERITLDRERHTATPVTVQRVDSAMTSKGMTTPMHEISNRSAVSLDDLQKVMG
ncbi:MAG: hypothetical protein RLN69_03020 [Woeseiaceae bacterium]